MVSAMNQPTRMSTLVLSADQSLNGAVVTCFAGGSTSDPQAGNLTIQVISEMLFYRIASNFRVHYQEYMRDSKQLLIAGIFRGYKPQTESDNNGFVWAV